MCVSAVLATHAAAVTLVALGISFLFSFFNRPARATYRIVVVCKSIQLYVFYTTWWKERKKNILLFSFIAMMMMMRAVCVY